MYKYLDTYIYVYFNIYIYCTTCQHTMILDHHIESTHPFIASLRIPQRVSGLLGLTTPVTLQVNTHLIAGGTDLRQLEIQTFGLGLLPVFGSTMTTKKGRKNADPSSMTIFWF